MSWDPKEYGGLRYVRLPASEVFTPDIVLFNNADQRLGKYCLMCINSYNYLHQSLIYFLENKRDALVVIYNAGEILWVPTSIFRSTCSIDIKFFPYDQQNCSMVFGRMLFLCHIKQKISFF